MHDPLRERDRHGKLRAGQRRTRAFVLHRTNGVVEASYLPESAGPTVHREAEARFQAPSSPPRMGHNGGPLLAPDDPNESWRTHCWRRAHKAAWKTPPREIALRRLERAEALGMSYHDYALEILERGRYL